MESTGALLKSTLMEIMLVFNGATVAQDVLEVMRLTHVHIYMYLIWLYFYYSTLISISVFSFLLNLESTNDTYNESDTKFSCKAPGNPRCNPESWDRYGGYSNACCSEEEKCTINEGDCNLDTECYGSLICLPNSCPPSKDESRKFHKRASCCQQPSGTYKLGTNINFL